MTSIKLKFRPSTMPGKEGSIVFQLIYGRAVRRITSEYKIFAEEWDDEAVFHRVRILLIITI